MSFISFHSFLFFAVALCTCTKVFGLDNESLLMFTVINILSQCNRKGCVIWKLFATLFLVCFSLVRYLEKCQNVRNTIDVGGFAGGPYQMSHLATTYGAINALTTIQSEYAYSIIDRYVLANIF